MLSEEVIEKIENEINSEYERAEQDAVKLEINNSISTKNWEKVMNQSYSAMAKQLDKESNIYLIFDDRKTLLYAGKAKSKIRKRLREHLVSRSNSTQSKLKKIKSLVMRQGVREIYIATFRVEPDWFLSGAEAYIISKYKPKWNRRND